MAKKDETKKRHVLIAISGTSPAVLTEAVWAMAMNDKIVPNRVIVLTTGKGKKKIEEELLNAGGAWDALKKDLTAAKFDLTGKLIFTAKSIRTFVDENDEEIEDLTTRGQNLLAANLMMKEVREFADDGDCVIHALLSGGRKTMGALFFSTMCLLGRPCDHVCHVLVSEGFDLRLDPPFYFPHKGIVHKGRSRDGEEIALKSSACKVNLFDVPFVPMGEWAEQKCKARKKGLNYENLIDLVNSGIRDDVYPKIKVDLAGKGTVLLDGKKTKNFSGYEFALFVMMLQGKCANDCLDQMRDVKDYVCNNDDELEYVFDKWSWLEKFTSDSADKNDDGGKFARWGHTDMVLKVKTDLTKTLNSLKGKLPKTPSMDRLVCRDSFPSDFDLRSVEWTGLDGVPRETLERVFSEATLAAVANRSAKGGAKKA